jgi:hypothetical protein
MVWCGHDLSLKGKPQEENKQQEMEKIAAGGLIYKQVHLG